MERTPDMDSGNAGQQEPPQEPGQEQPGAAADEAGAGEPRQADVAAAEATAVVEAILFATDSPLPAARIAQIAQLAGREVRSAIASLNQRYEQMGCVFRIEEIAGGYQMLTQPQYHDVLSRLFRARADTKLSQAALETLAVIAYRQPILRADIEAVRGVACGEVLRGLMEKQLVKIVGRAEVIGRPMLYGTTRRFLEVFGLASLDDLPRVEELRSGASAGVKAPAASDTQPASAGPAGQPPQDSPPAGEEHLTGPEGQDGGSAG